jgi:hypothetical protein
MAYLDTYYRKDFKNLCNKPLVFMKNWSVAEACSESTLVPTLPDTKEADHPQVPQELVASHPGYSDPSYYPK